MVMLAKTKEKARQPTHDTVTVEDGPSSGEVVEKPVDVLPAQKTTSDTDGKPLSTSVEQEMDTSPVVLPEVAIQREEEEGQSMASGRETTGNGTGSPVVATTTTAES